MAEKIENSLNVPKLGMQLSKAHSEVLPQEYTLLVNGNIESFDTSPLKITNESSNTLCSRFKPYFEITGILPVNPLNKTYFFLNNPTTGESEIGYISNVYYENKDDEDVNCSACDTPTKEATPLELQDPSPLCTYTTFISNTCLDFNVKTPISATYRITDRGLILFFAQKDKPFRYIEEWDVPYVKIPTPLNTEGCVSCEEQKYTDELDCNRIKVLKNYQDPCISFEDVTSNGSLKAGVYQFLISYADERETQITDFSNYSLPISIYQREITVNTDYPTNKAIKLRISNLFQEFETFKLVVVETLENISTAYLVGTFPISTQDFIFTYTGNNRQAEIQLSANELRRKRPVYTSAELVAQNNDFLFWGKLKEQRPINLQPVVNSLRIKPATIETYEGFYSNPISYDSVSYLRDEVVPFSIYFKTSNGYQTADFLISNEDVDYYNNKILYNGNPVKVDYELPLDNPNVLSTQGCEDERPNKYWQVFNAAPSGFVNICDYKEGSVEPITRKLSITCEQQYEEGKPIPPLCTPTDSSYEEFDGCVTEVLSPSGVMEYFNYSASEKSINAPKPVDDKKEETFVTNDTFFKSTIVVEDPPNTFTSIPYKPDNVTQGSAVEITSGIGTACSTDPTGDPFNTTGTGLIRYARVFFSPVNKGNVTENYFSLTITNPIATAIKIKMYTGNATITVTKQNGTELGEYNLPDNVAGNNVTTNGFFRIINNLKGLSPGDILNIKVTYTGTSFPLPVWDGVSQDTPVKILNWYNYGNICIYNPTPIGDVQKQDVPTIYIRTCTYSKTVEEKGVKDLTCIKRPARQYDFAYWESSLCYPNNPEVWGDLCGKKIRYHKFPDSKVVPLHDNLTESDNLVGRKLRIYPIGIQIKIEDVKNILNQAVQQGLLTEQEKLNITSFGIKRGNRRQNKSIIAKGQLYDMWKTFVLNENKTAVTVANPKQTFEYYSNYPFNDLNKDPFLQVSIYGQDLTHPFEKSARENNRYTFHSPETSYNNPPLGTEFKIDSIEWGYANITLSEVRDHSKYTLLTPLAVNVSEALASGRIVLEASNAAFSAGSFSFTVLGTGTDLSIINFAIYLAIGLAAGFVANLDKYTIEQATIFKNLISPKNYCYYYQGVGFYNNSVFINNNLERQRASLNTAIYLKPGNIQISEFNQTININNFKRESSVYFSLQDNDGNDTAFFKKPDFYSLVADNSRVIIPDANQTETRNITSYYGAIKNYVPDQYGFPEQIEWVDTGHCGRIDWTNPNQTNPCEIIFGGDTYIGRHSFKRKFPYFIQDRINFPPNTDLNLQELGNIAYPVYWFNTNNSYLRPIRRPKDLARRAPDANLYQTNDDISKEETKGLTPGSFIRFGKAFLYQNCINSFICESDYNLDLRHGENETNKNFYPNILDTEEFTQPTNVPFEEDNYYFYNTTYSKQLTENLYYSLKPFYNQEEENQKLNKRNRVLQSQQYNPYTYSANDFHDFDFNDGDLVGIKGIEQAAVLVTQTNASKVFNAFIEIPATVANIQVTTGSVFNQKPRQYYKTDLGFGGATHQQIVSTPYGHFYIDSENPSIIQLQGNSQKDITQDTENKKVRQWFTTNIPFQIKRQFPEITTDNPLNNIGFTMGWDNKFQRLFITKLDYKVKKEFLSQITYNQQFYLNNNPISITPAHFEDKSWTISYSPKADQFISFYTFKPNNYISHETYFQTLYNNAPSLYTHLQNQQSYQVFNGLLHPFILEYVVKNNYNNKILNNISYISEFRRYQDNLNYYLVQNKTFNKALIYTDSQSSGYLSLNTKQNNNAQQQFLYLSEKLSHTPPYTYTEILVDNTQDTYSFNQFQDKVNDKNVLINNELQTIFNRQPILHYTPNNPAYKELNPLSLSYLPQPYKRNLSNSYFVIRLENDLHSNYQILTQHYISNVTNGN
jgi:hypothetical protein